MPGTNERIVTAQEKWEENMERLEDVGNICGACAQAICCLILALLAFAAAAAVAALWFYFYVLSPSIIHTQIETCFEPVETSCLVSNISYSLKNTRRKCEHAFEYTFTVVPSEKVFVFIEEQTAIGDLNCSSQEGNAVPTKSVGPTECFKAKPICFYEELSCAKPNQPCYALFLIQPEPLGVFIWMTIVFAAGCCVACVCCGIVGCFGVLAEAYG